MSVLLVAAGSAAGGVLRWLVGELLQPGSGPRADAGFPLATLLVNVSGSFLLGILAVAVASRAPADGGALRLLLMVGFCGGYTTFSTFSLETLSLVQRGDAGLAAMNVTANIVLAITATFGGMLLARTILSRIG